jgi:WD40 repeat protein
MNHTATTARNVIHPAPHPTKPAAKPAQITAVKQRLVFQHHQQLVRAVVWSSTGNMLASGADDSHLLIWNMAGNITHDIQHPGPVHGVAWSSDGQRLVTGSLTQVAFFNALSGNLLARSTHRHTQEINSVAWTGKNKQQAVSAGNDKRAIVWDTQNYQAVLTYQLHTAPIEVVSWSSDGQLVASSSSGGAVRVWNAASGQDVHGYYLDAKKSMRALEFAPNSGEIAVGGDDGIVRLWNNGTVCMNTNGTVCLDMPQRFTLSNMAIRAVSWSPDMRYLAVGTDDGKFLVLQPATTGMKPLVTQPLNAPVRSITWSPDGKHIATGTGNQVILWDIM